MYIFFCPQDFDLLDNLLDIGHVSRIYILRYIYLYHIRKNEYRQRFFYYLSFIEIIKNVKFAKTCNNSMKIHIYGYTNNRFDSITYRQTILN